MSEQKKAHTEQFVVEETVWERLDVFLCGKYEGRSRSFFKGLMEQGLITLNGKTAKGKEQPKAGNIIQISFPEAQAIDAAPQDIPLEIIYQDDDIAVINKPKGMVVHPAAGNAEGTLVNAALYHLEGLSGINGKVRPGIVHRLDKDTSGLLVIAKNDAAHISLAKQIKDKTAFRVYLAIVHGNLKEEEGTINAPIARHKSKRKIMAVLPEGREAVTHYRVLERFGEYTLVEARLQTGRTHQIRVHMKHIGHPVAGDTLYGPKKTQLSDKGQLLHAYKLGFKHPKTGEELLFEAPLEAEFERALGRLRRSHKTSSSL